MIYDEENHMLGLVCFSLNPRSGRATLSKGSVNIYDGWSVTNAPLNPIEYLYTRT
jgi:hypothetical protein